MCLLLQSSLPFVDSDNFLLGSELVETLVRKLLLDFRTSSCWCVPKQGVGLSLSTCLVSFHSCTYTSSDDCTGDKKRNTSSGRL